MDVGSDWSAVLDVCGSITVVEAIFTDEGDCHGDIVSGVAEL